MIICILHTFVQHTITVSMLLRSASMERQQFTVLRIQQSKSCIVPSLKRGSIGHLDRKEGKRHDPCPILDTSINGVSSIFDLASWIVTGLRNGINSWSQYWPPWWAKMLLTILLLCSKISINGASMLLGIVSWIIKWQCSGVIPSLKYWLPIGAKMLVTISPLPPNNEHELSFNGLGFAAWIIKGLRNGINP